MRARPRSHCSTSRLAALPRFALYNSTDVDLVVALKIVHAWTWRVVPAHAMAVFAFGNVYVTVRVHVRAREGDADFGPSAAVEAAKGVLFWGCVGVCGPQEAGRRGVDRARDGALPS